MDSVLNVFSLNIGMSATLAGLSTIVKVENLDLLLLQEVRISKEQIEQQLRGFTAVVNMDPDLPFKPGTAIAWRETLMVSEVSTLVDNRLQVASIGPYKILNIYYYLLLYTHRYLKSKWCSFYCTRNYHLSFCLNSTTAQSFGERL